MYRPGAKAKQPWRKTQRDKGRRAEPHALSRKSQIVTLLVSWCFEPSQPLGIISGLKKITVPHTFNTMSAPKWWIEKERSVSSDFMGLTLLQSLDSETVCCRVGQADPRWHQLQGLCGNLSRHVSREGAAVSRGSAATEHLWNYPGVKHSMYLCMTLYVPCFQSKKGIKKCGLEDSASFLNVCILLFLWVFFAGMGWGCIGYFPRRDSICLQFTYALFLSSCVHCIWRSWKGSCY